MSVPPYVCGAVGLYIFAVSSDHRRERGYHILGGLLITLIGLIITVATNSNGAKYAGLCILLFGSYVSSPLTVAWLSGNTPGKQHTHTPTLATGPITDRACRTRETRSRPRRQWLRQSQRRHRLPALPRALRAQVSHVSKPPPPSCITHEIFFLISHPR